eukprot:m.390103 g.390103  ORF g.390103 m.390103 type:complete len:1321 (-) comp20074_c6_seq3:93-4055(-)
MTEETRYVASISYWARNKYFRHMQNDATEAKRKTGSDQTFTFWEGVGLLLEGRSAEAMRLLQPLLEKSETALCASLALSYAHKQSTLVDKEAIEQLDARSKKEVKTCGEIALHHAGLFLWHTGRHDKARELADKMLKINAASIDALALRGWIDLTSGRESHAKKCIKYFDDALKQDDTPEGVARRMDALLGKIQYLQQQKSDYTRSLQLLDRAVVAFDHFAPALMEKAKAQVAVGEWDLALETAQRVLSMDASLVEALSIRVLHVLCRTGRYQTAATQLGDLISAIDHSEPKSHDIYYRIAVPVLRLSSRQRLVLEQATVLLNRAITLAPSNAEYHTEKGHLFILAGQEREAMKAYKHAMKLDETSIAALNGVILCQLLENQLEDAEQQLEFLSAIQTSIGKTAEFSFLSALLASKQNQAANKVISLLDEAVETHIASLEGESHDFDYFRKLAPDLVLQIAKLYFQYTPNEAPAEGETPSPILAKIVRVLELVTKVAPGLTESVYLLARAKFLSGISDAAQSGVQFCLQQDSTYADAHLLMAEIHLSQNNTKAAEQSLEVGLSYNFEVRDSPLYSLIKAKILRSDGKTTESVRTLLAAMKLPGVRRAVTNAPGAKRKNKKTIALADRVSVFLELALSYILLNQPHEAAKVMSDATSEFKDTSEETRVTIADAEMAVSRGDIEGALKTLRNITPEQPYYVKAKEAMAQIYLVHRKDKRLYVSCYRELMDKNPTPHSGVLLGDAYMSIQEPEKAIAVYESALKKNPRDSALASKIGRALVKTHDYSKAINYYEAAVKSGDQSSLRGDLADLYLKLKQFDKAEKALTAALEHEQTNDLMQKIADVRFLMQTAEMHSSAGRPGQSIQYLNDARERQAQVLGRVATEQPEALKQQQQLAADICFRIAKHYEQAEDTQRAMQAHQEALGHKNDSADSMLALAKLYLAANDLEAAQFQLTALLRHDKQNNDGTVMLAELMFLKNEYDSATFHFQQLLEREPDHFDALAKLIGLLRRAGKLAESGRAFLDKAEKASPHPDTDPGLNFCKGLYARYTHCPNDALKYFNLARKDADVGVQALYHMIEICFNPEGDTLGGETFEGGADSEKVAVGLKTADRLLGELRQRREEGKLRFQLLSAYAKMTTQNKSMIEKALQDFMRIAKEHRDHVGALLGMARCQMLLKQVPKARAHLKVISKMDWNSEDADDFEAAWLLYADVFISAGKYDVAQPELKKTLRHNKSCSKAWEYIGYIMEKEQSYADAAEYYENAWQFSGETNPAIGFKLAFNYLKARRFVEAIDVCHVVLKKHPDYPKIRKDVLEKARSGLRS